MSVVINGSAGVTTNSGAVYDGIQSGTAITASGTSVDFTSIPSWVKRITVMFNAVSTSGTSNIQVQLGDSGGVETTGYVSSAARVQGSSTTTLGAVTSGFVLASLNAAADAQNGSLILSKINGNNWVSQGVLYATTYVAIHSSAGAKTLSDTLTQVRITTVNGTDTFDAGTINILFE
jgi:hypothetical protein